MTVNQAEAQFAMWSIWSAILLMSNDLRFIAPSFKKILLNKKVIAINQDPLGIMGRLIVNVSHEPAKLMFELPLSVRFF